MPKPIAKALRPYWTTSDSKTVKLYLGHVTEVLGGLPSGSVHCVVTSPPYWGLRDYKADKRYEIGCEKTPQEYVDRMVRVFREVRRVLRDDGTLWLNLGDTYGGGGNFISDELAGHSKKLKQQQQQREQYKAYGAPDSGLRSGNLVGIPWRVALALQADGWVLRQDIIWHKPSPMPESVKNRCTKAHEYIFLLTKRMGYFYDAEAIKELRPDAKPWTPRNDQKFVGEPRSDTQTGFSKIEAGRVFNTANKRSVWTIASQGYDGAHFATYPPKLIEPCILAGTSERGCCEECGAPYRRVVENQGPSGGHQHDRKGGGDNPYNNEDQWGLAAGGAGANWKFKTIGWESTCSCGDTKIVPCTILDPFIGSGTTCCVAIAHGRRSIGIDLSEVYLRDNAIPRIEGELLKMPATSHLIRREVKRLDLGKRISDC